tara:strand:- start:9325 stop:10446 length:1122 start_codon:yes stop_codon:yes gene_type:complete
MAKLSRVNPGTPAAVKKQARAADALHKKIYGETESAPVAEAAPQAQEGVTPAQGEDSQPVEAQAAEVPLTDTPQGPPITPVAAEDTITAEPVVAEEPKPEAEPEAKPEPNEWETRYRSLQGKYDAEVPRMAQEIREMRAQLAAAVAAQTPAPAPDPVAEKKSIVSDTDLEDYGEDLVGFIKRVAKDEAAQASESLKPQIDEVRGQVHTSVQQTKTNSVYAKLDGSIQDWRQINSSPGFISWLNTSDPYVGDLRSNLLTDAFKKADSERVVAFFKGYQAEQKLVNPDPVVPSDNPAPAPAPAPAVTLEQLAGPAGNPGGGQETATDPAEPPSWTRAQISAFYSDVNKGVFKDDPGHKAQLENSIAEAMAANRVH